jgi:hypothetical protein
VLGEPLKLGAIEHLGIDHTHKQCLDGPITKPVHNAFRGAPGYTLPRLGWPINKCAIVDAVGQIAFFFKAPQNCTNRGVLQRPVQLFPNLVGGDTPIRQTMSRTFRSSSPNSPGSWFALVLPSIVLPNVTHWSTEEASEISQNNSAAY